MPTSLREQCAQRGDARDAPRRARAVERNGSQAGRRYSCAPLTSRRVTCPLDPCPRGKARSISNRQSIGLRTVLWRVRVRKPRTGSIPGRGMSPSRGGTRTVRWPNCGMRTSHTATAGTQPWRASMERACACPNSNQPLAKALRPTAAALRDRTRGPGEHPRPPRRSTRHSAGRRPRQSAVRRTAKCSRYECHGLAPAQGP